MNTRTLFAALLLIGITKATVANADQGSAPPPAQALTAAAPNSAQSPSAEIAETAPAPEAAVAPQATPALSVAPNAVPPPGVQTPAAPPFSADTRIGESSTRPPAGAISGSDPSTDSWVSVTPTTAPAADPSERAPLPAPAVAQRTQVESPLPDAPSSDILVRAFAGGGFTTYEDRSDGDAHMFSEVGFTLSVGYVPLSRSSGGSLGVSAEALLAHSPELSDGARAAGNLLGGGIVLSTTLGSGEIGVGGYLLSRAPEARTIGLIQGRHSAGVGAFIAREWPLNQRLAMGFTVRVFLLPTRTTRESDGQKRVHFAEGIGLLGISASFR